MIERLSEKHSDIIKPIRGVRELQSAYAQFSSYINPEQTPQTLSELLKEEVDELRSAITTGSKEEVQGEVADVIFFTVQIANQYDIDLERALGAKMTRNYHKYNPEIIQSMVDHGLTHTEAKATLKRAWDRNRDKWYC